MVETPLQESAESANGHQNIPAQEPVAWRYSRFKQDWTLTTVLSEHDIEILRSSGVTVEPLFAAPPPIAVEGWNAGRDAAAQCASSLHLIVCFGEGDAQINFETACQLIAKRIREMPLPPDSVITGHEDRADALDEGALKAAQVARQKALAECEDACCQSDHDREFIAAYLNALNPAPIAWTYDHAPGPLAATESEHERVWVRRLAWAKPPTGDEVGSDFYRNVTALSAPAQANAVRGPHKSPKNPDAEVKAAEALPDEVRNAISFLTNGEPPHRRIKDALAVLRAALRSSTQPSESPEDAYHRGRAEGQIDGHIEAKGR